MKYAIAWFNEKTSTIDDTNVTWHEGTQEQAEQKVKKRKGICALFYYKDVNVGIPVKPDASREEFEADPARLGICFYHCWQGYRYE